MRRQARSGVWGRAPGAEGHVQSARHSGHALQKRECEKRSVLVCCTRRLWFVEPRFEERCRRNGAVGGLRDVVGWCDPINLFVGAKYSGTGLIG